MELFEAEGVRIAYATEGEGDRSTGLGIYGRPCHYAFSKQTTPAKP